MASLTPSLLAFVREDLLQGREVEIHADTYLFEEGLVDSLGILRLIAFLELRIGRPISDSEIVMEHFRTVNAIDRRFGGGDQEPGGVPLPPSGGIGGRGRA